MKIKIECPKCGEISQIEAQEEKKLVCPACGHIIFAFFNANWWRKRKRRQKVKIQSKK